MLDLLHHLREKFETLKKHFFVLLELKQYKIQLFKSLFVLSTIEAFIHLVEKINLELVDFSLKLCLCFLSTFVLFTDLIKLFLSVLIFFLLGSHSRLDFRHFLFSFFERLSFIFPGLQFFLLDFI